MQLEHAKVSLTGHRAENQDRVDVVSQGPSVLMIVVDGMGGHAEGAKASEAIVGFLTRSFREAGQPVLDQAELAQGGELGAGGVLGHATAKFRF